MDALEIEARRRALEDARADLAAATRQRLNSRRPKTAPKPAAAAPAESDLDLSTLATALSSEG